jgi:hypothetical protein
MNRQPHAGARELIVANAMAEVVTELRMVDVADYIAFIRMERFGAIADLVDTAAELYFLPGTLRLGHGCDLLVSWEEAPRIKLDMELRPRGATVFFSLTLGDRQAEVDVTYVSFHDAAPEPALNTAWLESALDDARLKPRAVAA